MYNLNIEDVVLSIENAPIKNLNGIIYQEYPKFFGKVIRFPKLDSIEFEKLTSQEHLPRRKILKTNLFLKEMQILFMNSNITKSLEKKFNQKLKFDSIDLWIDDEGYFLPPHLDNEKIKLHLQIYLDNYNVGTSLYNFNKEKIYTFPYKMNCGYALLNNKHSLHGVETVIKDGRKSIYVRYQ